MFKFKNENNFDKKNKIYRNYSNINNPTITTNINEEGITKSNLSDTNYYLYDIRSEDMEIEDEIEIDGKTITIYKFVWFRGKSATIFPELLDERCKSCLTTNDGLVIFNFDDNGDKWCIVYDLVHSSGIEFDDISDDIINHIELIEHHKYTSPRVHCLDIDGSGNVIPKVIFKDKNVTMYDNKDIISLDTHFSLDVDLDIKYRIENGIKYDIDTNEKYSSSTSEIGRDTNIGIDEYGYYVCEYFEGLFSTDKLKIDNISIDNLSKILVSDKKIENSTCVPHNEKEFYYMLSDGESFKIRLDSDSVPCKIYLCY